MPSHLHHLSIDRGWPPLSEAEQQIARRHEAAAQASSELGGWCKRRGASRAMRPKHPFDASLFDAGIERKQSIYLPLAVWAELRMRPA